MMAYPIEPNPQDPFLAWEQEETERLNNLARLANELGYTVPTGPLKPVPLNEDGTEVSMEQVVANAVAGAIKEAESIGLPFDRDALAARVREGVLANYNPAQPRGPDGKWAGGGTGVSYSAKDIKDALMASRKATGFRDNTLDSHCETFAKKCQEELASRGVDSVIEGVEDDGSPTFHVFVKTLEDSPAYIDASGVYDSADDLVSSFKEANEDLGFGDSNFKPLTQESVDKLGGESVLGTSLITNYNPNQPRDARGRWGTGGGGGGSAAGSFAPSPQLWNHQPTAVLRWMGKNGWTKEEAAAVFARKGVEVAHNTLRSQISIGAGKTEGPPNAKKDLADLTTEQIADLESIRQSLGKDNPPPSKPVKERKPKVEKKKEDDEDAERKKVIEDAEAKKGALIARALLGSTAPETEFNRRIHDMAYKAYFRDPTSPGSKLTKDDMIDIGQEVQQEIANRTYQIKAEREKAGLKVTAGVTLDAARKEATLEVLAEIRDIGRPMKIESFIPINKNEGDFTKAQHQEVAKLVENASKDFPNAWTDDMPSHYSYRTTRGYHSERDRTITVSSDGEKAKTTATHEVGHAVEAARPIVRKLEADFLRSRIKPGEKPVLYNTSPEFGDEWVYEDDFDRPYAGKTYSYKSPWYPKPASGEPSVSDIASHEVFTMGVQEVLHGRTLWTKNTNFDDQYTRFILGVLASVP